MGKNLFRQNRDEFDWEREMRKDEMRINTYMKELPKFIDLPDEESVILKKMQSYPDLIPPDSEWGTYMSGSSDDFDVDDDAPEDENWQDRDGADIYMTFTRLSYHWAIVFASSIRKDCTVQAMRILCQYGKLIARAADILDVEAEELPSLRLALSKRLIAETSAMMKDMKDLSSNQPEISQLTTAHTDKLQELREKLLDLSEKIRREKDNGKK